MLYNVVFNPGNFKKKRFFFYFFFFFGGGGGGGGGWSVYTMVTNNIKQKIKYLVT